MSWFGLIVAVAGGMASADASATEGKAMQRGERLKRDLALIRSEGKVAIAESRRKAANLANQRATVAASEVLFNDTVDRSYSEFAAKEQVVLKAQRDIAKVNAKASLNASVDSAGSNGLIESIINRSEQELKSLKVAQEKTERKMVNLAGGIQANYINGYDGNIAQVDQFKLYKRDVGGQAMLAGINAFVSAGGVNAAGSLLGS